MVSEETVLENLKQIIDPEVGINIVDMGLIYGVDINDETVGITMTLTSPPAPPVDSLSTARKTSPNNWKALTRSTLMLCGPRRGHRR